MKLELKNSLSLKLLRVVLLLSLIHISIVSEEVEQADAQGPDAPRLLKQPLTSQAARASIEALLDEPPFQHRETVTRWRLGEEKPAEEPKQEDVEAFLEMLRNLLKLGEWWKSLDVVAQIFEVLLWAALATLLAFVVSVSYTHLDVYKRQL